MSELYSNPGFIWSSVFGLRFVGWSEWCFADKKGKFNWDFLNHKEKPLEEVNMNYTLINYRGLSNLGNELHIFSLYLKTIFCCEMVFCGMFSSFWGYLACKFSISAFGYTSSEGQQFVRTLSLRGCPEVDDWFLARLHILQDSLKELDISHCPRITTGGLAALSNLKYVSKNSLFV